MKKLKMDIDEEKLKGLKGKTEIRAWGKIPESKPFPPTPVLTPFEIGDNLDLEVEGSYPSSNGSWTHTISVDRLLKAQLAKAKKEEYEFLDKILHMPFFEFCLLVKERKEALKGE